MSDYLKGKRVVDPVLTSIARGYKNAAFIGERIFPIVLTDKEGVTVPTFGKSAFVEYDTERAVGADSNVLVREKTGKLDLGFSTSTIWPRRWTIASRQSRCSTKRPKPFAV